MISFRHILSITSKKTLAIYLRGIPLALIISFFIFIALSAYKNGSDLNTKLTNDTQKINSSTIDEYDNADHTITNSNNTAATVNRTPTTESAPINNKPTPIYRPFECKKIPVSKRVEYRNDDSMPKGATKNISTGQDGYYISCTADSTGYTPPTNGTRIEPLNDIIAVGTGFDEQRQQQAAAEEAARDQRYYLNLANCTQSLKAQGMQPSSAESHCRSIVRR